MKKILTLLLPSEITTNKKFRKMYSGVLLLAITIRLILFFITVSTDETGFLLPDSKGYLQLAENISERGIYSLEPGEPFYPDFFRTPFYPAVIILFDQLNTGIIGIILFQILAGLITCMVTMKITSVISGTTKTILFSGLLFAVDIPSVVMGNMVMTENLFTLLFTLAVLNFIFYLKNKTNKNLLWSSLLMGLAALTRPVIIYLPVLIIFYLFFLKKREPEYLIRPVFLFLLPFTILAGSWSLRNYIVHKHLFYSYIGTFNLLYFQASDIYSKKNDIHINEARTLLYNEIMAGMDEQPDKAPMTFYSRMDKKAKSVILSEPILLIKNLSRGAINFFFRPVRFYLDHAIGAKPLHYYEKDYSGKETAANLLSQKSPPVTQIAVIFQYIFSVLVFVGMIAGLISIYNSHREVFWFLLLITFYFMLVSSGPEAEARFRVPVIPVMVALASVGIFNPLSKKSPFKSA